MYDDVGYCELFGDNGFTRHFMVATEKGFLPDISPNINHARRIAAEAIKGGGKAIVFQSVEAIRDKGATLEILHPEDWE
jgi:hypothetical protein